jgi:hypothetical protein
MYKHVLVYIDLQKYHYVIYSHNKRPLYNLMPSDCVVCFYQSMEMERFSKTLCLSKIIYLLVTLMGWYHIKHRKHCGHF